MTPTSVVLHDETMYGDLGTPFDDHTKVSQSEERVVESPSPIGALEMGRISPVFVNRPQTPPTPEQTATSPVELPGSILLPSQGFPQTNPPITPARDISHIRSSEESERSSTPSLYTSSSTDGEMDILKNLTSPQKRSGRVNTLPVSPMKNASKPFTAMTVEELMQCLPELNMSTVSHSWVPAMEGELKRIKALLQEAAELRLQSQARFENFGGVSLKSYECLSPTNFCQDVNSIAVSARDISRTYFDAMQRVRPLADRDAKAINDQLEFTQAELQTALAVVEENKDIISDKDDLIQRLHETITANSQTFSGFIQDHVGSRIDNLHDIRTQEIRQLIKGEQHQSPDNGTHTPGRYIRIPENEYNSCLQEFRNNQQKVETYSKIANEQLELIKSQSADLDKRMEGYGECLVILEKRHNRIVELESKLEAIGRELSEAKETVEAYNILKESNESLGKHCTDLEWTLQSIKNCFKKQLEDRETEIFTLRQRLGDSVLEAAAHKAEAKLAVSQPTSISVSSRFKNPLHLGRNSTAQDRNLPINMRRALLGGKLPASQSMLSLNTPQANLGPDKLSARRNAPSPLSDTARPSGDSSSSQNSGRWLSGLRMNPPQTAIRTSNIPVFRPRKDSLCATTDQSPKTATPTTGVADGRPASMLLNPIDREKALPSPPPPAYPSQNIHHLHNENEGDDHQLPAVSSHTVPPTTSRAMPPPISPRNPARERSRVLSGITERSFEESTGNNAPAPSSSAQAQSQSQSPNSTSTSSSDKKAFRSSMAMLERFEGMGIGGDDEDGDVEGRRGGEGGGERGGWEIISPPVESGREKGEYHERYYARREGRA